MSRNLFMNYFINLDSNKESILIKMVYDKEFWPIPPKDTNELVQWAIDDYIDYYHSYQRSKKGKI